MSLKMPILKLAHSPNTVQKIIQDHRQKQPSNNQTVNNVNSGSTIVKMRPSVSFSTKKVKSNHSLTAEENKNRQSTSSKKDSSNPVYGKLEALAALLQAIEKSAKPRFHLLLIVSIVSCILLTFALFQMYMLLLTTTRMEMILYKYSENSK
jgi:hypothetical protein